MKSDLSKVTSHDLHIKRDTRRHVKSNISKVIGKSDKPRLIGK